MVDYFENLMQELKKTKKISFLLALLPILFLSLLLIYGLILRPLLFSQPAFPLEIVFILSAVFAITELFLIGYGWREIQQAIVGKLAKAIPAFFILFTIGLIISSWMVSGTIPMLVYYGIKIINPDYLYFLAFLIPVVFSSLTGTSWGSVGTIGVVIIGICGAVGGDPGITAGAIIGGAYFGDKMSPLSDTTNVAALATEVELFDHIQSMMVTTLPSALLAAVSFFALGFIYPPAAHAKTAEATPEFLQSLASMFHFNIALLLPPVIVLIGSIKKKPPIPTLIVSVLTAALLALFFQEFTLADVVQSLYKGFDAAMAPWMASVPESVAALTNRGGLYALIDAITIPFMIFIFIGAIDCINAMPIVVHKIFFFANSRRSTILSSLIATGLTNVMTSNQYATSFVVGEAFKSKYDALRIPRKVLSRSLEDTGTMLESVVPWTTTTVFMVATLNVPFADYWHWQLLSLINFVVAPTVAMLGIGCFYHEMEGRSE